MQVVDVQEPKVRFGELNEKAFGFRMVRILNVRFIYSEGSVFGRSVWLFNAKLDRFIYSERPRTGCSV